MLTRFMLSVVGKPMMIPCPMYDRLGVNVHIHCDARYVPKSGIENTTGKKYASSWAWAPLEFHTWMRT